MFKRSGWDFPCAYNTYAHHCHHRNSELSDSDAFCSGAWCGHHIATGDCSQGREETRRGSVARNEDSSFPAVQPLHVSLLVFFTMWITRLPLPARDTSMAREAGGLGRGLLLLLLL